MASGTIYGTTSNEKIESRIVWSSVANNSANTSALTVSLWYRRTDTEYTTYGTGSFSLYAGATRIAFDNSATISIGNTWVKVIEL